MSSTKWQVPTISHTGTGTEILPIAVASRMETAINRHVLAPFIGINFGSLTQIQSYFCYTVYMFPLLFGVLCLYNSFKNVMYNFKLQVSS